MTSPRCSWPRLKTWASSEIWIDRGNVDERREALHVDLDEVNGILGRGLRLADDQRHRLSGEDRDVPGERLVSALITLADDREVVGGQDGHHVWHGQGRCGIDGDDARVRVHAGDDTRVQEARHGQVSCIPGGADDLFA